MKYAPPLLSAVRLDPLQSSDFAEINRIGLVTGTRSDGWASVFWRDRVHRTEKIAWLMPTTLCDDRKAETLVKEGYGD